MPQRLSSLLETMTTPKQTNQPGTGQTPRPVSDDTILKVAKEVVVKFIEVGRLSPANFGETFENIYKSVRDTVRS